MAKLLIGISILGLFMLVVYGYIQYSNMHEDLEYQLSTNQRIIKKIGLFKEFRYLSRFDLMNPWTYEGIHYDGVPARGTK